MVEHRNAWIDKYVSGELPGTNDSLESCSEVIFKQYNHNNPIRNNCFSLFKWFKRGNQDFESTELRKDKFIHRSNSLSNTESLDSLHSTTTVHSIAFISGSQRNINNEELSLQSTQTGSSMSTGNKSNENLDKKMIDNAAYSLPNIHFYRQENIDSNVKNNVASSSTVTIPNIKYQTLTNFNKSREPAKIVKVHVKGKRRAPNPPILQKNNITQSDSSFQNISRRRKRNPAPKPPTSVTLRKDIFKSDEPSSSKAPTTPNVQNDPIDKENNLKMQDESSASNRKELYPTSSSQTSTSKISTIPSINNELHSKSNRNIFSHFMRSEEKSKFPGTKRSSYLFDDSVSNLSYVYGKDRLKENKKNNRSSAGISVLTNISELDREAAAILREKQSQSRVSMLLEAYQTNRCSTQDSTNKDYSKGNTASSTEALVHRNPLPFISKLNNIDNVTKDNINFNFVPIPLNPPGNTEGTKNDTKSNGFVAKTQEAFADIHETPSSSIKSVSNEVSASNRKSLLNDPVAESSRHASDTLPNINHDYTKSLQLKYFSTNKLDEKQPEDNKRHAAPSSSKDETPGITIHKFKNKTCETTEKEFVDISKDKGKSYKDLTTLSGDINMLHNLNITKRTEEPKNILSKSDDVNILPNSSKYEKADMTTKVNINLNKTLVISDEKGETAFNDLKTRNEHQDQVLNDEVEKQKISCGVQTNENVCKINNSTNLTVQNDLDKKEGMCEKTDKVMPTASGTFQEDENFNKMLAYDDNSCKFVEDSLTKFAQCRKIRQKKKLVKGPTPKVIFNQSTDSEDVNHLLKNLEVAIASGHHQKAARLAKHLAQLKINCSCIRQQKCSRKGWLNVRLFIEDKEVHQGPITLELPENLTVADLKAKINLEYEIPINVQRWIIGKKLVTSDDSTLEELEATNGSTFFLYLIIPESQENGSGNKNETTMGILNSGLAKIHLGTDPFRETASGEEEVGTEEEKQLNETKLGRYEELVLLENYDVVSNVDPIECPICFTISGTQEGVILKDCLHAFCRQCLADTIMHCDEAEVKCPFRDANYSCDSILQEREIKALVTPDVYQKHLGKSITQAENNAGNNAFHCKTPNCPGWCIYEDNVNTFLCPVCNLDNCLTCQAIHMGKTCRRYQKELRLFEDTSEEFQSTAAMLEEMVSKGDALPCPTCAVILMKKWGCDWLRCSMCKTEICWVTRGPRWGPNGKGDTSGGCHCGENGVKCHPRCNYCH